MKKQLVSIFACSFLMSEVCFLSLPCEAFLFHATKKAAAKRIMRNGFSKAKMRTSARFGKGIYTSTKRKTALKETKGSKAIIRFKESKYLKKNTINMKNPTFGNVRKQFKAKDLRGTIKNKVVGPKLGRKMGKAAGKNGKVIQYRSVKDPNGSNIFIPKKVYENHPRIIHSKKVSK